MIRTTLYPNTQKCTIIIVMMMQLYDQALEVDARIPDEWGSVNCQSDSLFCMELKVK